jgi:hypothetical protein
LFKLAGLFDTHIKHPGFVFVGIICRRFLSGGSAEVSKHLLLNPQNGIASEILLDERGADLV